MSYEGYVQMLCKNGHYAEQDAYAVHSFDNAEGALVCHCGERYVWFNDVDQTNCEAEGVIDMDKYLKEEQVYCTCDKCGSSHRISYTTYNIPTDAGWRNEE